MKTLKASAVLTVSALFFLVPFAAAHGNETHQENKEVAAHMKAMYALKEEIPEEYRIMERSPVLPDEKSILQGQKLFAENCAICHGESGNGKGPAASSMVPPPANLLDKEHSAIYGPGEKFWIIGNGTGETNMPGFPGISPLGRWDLVNFILDLQKQVAPKTEGHGHH